MLKNRDRLCVFLFGNEPVHSRHIAEAVLFFLQVEPVKSGCCRHIIRTGCGMNRKRENERDGGNSDQFNFRTTLMLHDFDDSMIRTEPVEVALPERIEMLQAPLLSYFDEEYQVGEKPIYAIACVDAHGYSSHLSAQLEVTYNRFRNMLISRVVSGEGAPKSYPNLLLEEDAFEDAIKTSGHDRMTVFFDPEYYRVVKNLGKVGMNVVDLNKDPVEIDQNFLMVNPDEPTYKIQILNVDLLVIFLL